MTGGATDVVIVTWNSASTIAKCLQSTFENLAEMRGGGLTVVVDNESTDATADLVRTSFPAADFVRNPVNVGFASACDQGAARGRAEFVLFLNPDCKLRPGAIEALAAFMSDPAHDNVGACGPRLSDETGATTIAAARFPSARVMVGSLTRLSRLVPRLFPRHFYTPQELSAARPVDQVSGACFFVRRSVFESLNGFDERFFLYYEEVDLARRLRDAGWSSWYVPSAECTHVGSRSTDQVRALRLFWNLRGRVIYARKHFGPSGFLAMLAICLAEVALRLVATALQGRSSFSETVRGVRMLGGWALPWLRHGAPLKIELLR